MDFTPTLGTLVPQAGSDNPPSSFQSGSQGGSSDGSSNTPPAPVKTFTPTLGTPVSSAPPIAPSDQGTDQGNNQKQGGGIFSTLAGFSQRPADFATGIAKSFTSLPKTAAQFGTDIGSTTENAVDPHQQFGQWLSQNLPKGVLDSIKGVTQGMNQGANTPNQVTDPSNPDQAAGKMVGDIGQVVTPLGAEGDVKALGEAADAAKSSPKITQFIDGLKTLLGHSAQIAGATGVQTGSLKQAAIAGAASPLLEGGGNLIAGALKAVVPALSGVDRATYADMFANPDKYKAAEEIAKENPQSPMAGLASHTADAINAAEDKVTGKWTRAAVNFSKNNPGVTFDLQSKLPEMTKALQGNEQGIGGFGVKIQQARDAAGKLTGDLEAVSENPKVPTNIDLKQVNGVIGQLRNADELRPQDVLQLRRNLSSAINGSMKVGEPTPTTAALMKLKSGIDTATQDIMPKELKTANSQMASFYKMKDSGLGAKIVDSEGNVKPSAESFLSNLSGKNKGQQNAMVQEAIPHLGFDPADAAGTIKKMQGILSGGNSFSKANIVKRMIETAAGGAAAGAAFTGNPLAATAIGAGALGAEALGNPQLMSHIVQHLGTLDKAVPESLRQQIASGVVKALSRGTSEAASDLGSSDQSQQ